MLNLKA